MANRSKKRGYQPKRPWRRGARAIARNKPLWAGVLLAAMLALGALMAAFPSARQFIFGLAGMRPAAEIPVTGLSSPVAVHIIDVGQGDAALLAADGEYALIDAGPPESAETLVAYLHGAGVEKLRYLFMTHPHADHIGGMQAVVENFGVDTAVLPNFSLAPLPTTSAFEALLGAFAADGRVKVETARQGGEYPLGEGTVRVVHAGAASDDNMNLLSLGLMFEADGLRFLDTGDGEKANERAMLESGAALGCDVFMAAHHGSISTSNTQAFIEAVRPSLVVVSCGANNSYGHPHQEALDNYTAAGAEVLRTDECGGVVVQPDGQGGLAYAVQNSR